MRQQHKSGQQRAANGTCGVGRIKSPAGFGQLALGGSQCPHQNRKRAAHQERWHAYENEREQPGQQAYVTFQTGEQTG
ncbi:hypothetical protein D9M71_676190 [compost metagenome]